MVWTQRPCSTVDRQADHNRGHEPRSQWRKFRLYLDNRYREQVCHREIPRVSLRPFEEYAREDQNRRCG